MQMAPAWAWAENHGTVYDLNETHRIGYPAFEFLLLTYPEKLDGVEPKAKGNTCVVPLLVQDLEGGGWVLNEEGQPIWSCNIFWPVVFFVALEVMVSYRKRWEHTIAIYGFLWSYLVPFEDLLRRELKNVVTSMCRAFQIPLPLDKRDFSFSRLCDRRVLQMRGPENVQGSEVDIGFALCLSLIHI